MPSAMRFVLVGSELDKQERGDEADEDGEHGHADRGVAHGRHPFDASNRADARELDLRARQKQQHDEEHDRRQRVGDVGPAIGELEERSHPLRGEGEDHRAEIGERQAAQPTDHRGRERADDQERQRGGRHVGRLRREQDAGQRGERTAERPREARQHRRTCAAERGEIAVVDDRTHRDPDTRAEQQDAEPDREADRDHDRDEAVPREQHVADVEALAREQLRHRVRGVLVPDHVRDTDQREQQPDRDHELHHQGLALEPTHDRPVEPDPHQRRDHEHHERQPPRPAARSSEPMSCQSTYARNMPIAPCAKLKMPVVV